MINLFAFKNKKALAIVLVLSSTLLNTTAQFFLKSASSGLSFDISLFLNHNLFLGGLFYCTSLLFYVYALKFNELSVLAPLLSFQYVLVLFISSYFFKESIAPLQIMGLAFILAGVFFIAKEAKK
jgi:drug/metabolite transporter (DMT)-like permease